MSTGSMVALIAIGVVIAAVTIRLVLNARTRRTPARAQAAAPVRAGRSAPSPGPHIFVSYRRDDVPDTVGRIYDNLVGVFGSAHVFKDVDSIPLGHDFRTVIDHAVAQCDVMLVVIGPQWLSVDLRGRRRLDDPDDFVRLEIEAALRRGIPIIPMLAMGARFPAPQEMPEPIAGLSYRNGLSIRSDPDFHRDMERACNAVRAASAGR